jgi:hypothetical protein
VDTASGICLVNSSEEFKVRRDGGPCKFRRVVWPDGVWIGLKAGYPRTYVVARAWVSPAILVKVLLEQPVTDDERDDPVAVCPEVGSAVIDLGRGALLLAVVAAEEVGVIPVSPAFLIIADKGGMGLSELLQALAFAVEEPGQLLRVAGLVELQPVSKDIVFDLSGELGFEGFEERDLIAVGAEPDRTDSNPGLVPVAGSGLLAECRLLEAGGLAADLVELAAETGVKSKDSKFHGGEVGFGVCQIPKSPARRQGRTNHLPLTIKPYPKSARYGGFVICKLTAGIVQ